MKPVRTNRLLLALCFAGVTLMGPAFVLGYFVGHRTVLAATASRPNLAAPGNDHLAPGQVYLQVASVSKGKSPAMLEALRKGGFPAVAREVPEKQSLRRVLIGPLPKTAVGKTRAELQRKGFAGASAIETTF